MKPIYGCKYLVVFAIFPLACHITIFGTTDWTLEKCHDILCESASLQQNSSSLWPTAAHCGSLWPTATITQCLHFLALFINGWCLQCQHLMDQVASASIVVQWTFSVSLFLSVCITVSISSRLHLASRSSSHRQAYIMSSACRHNVDRMGGLMSSTFLLLPYLLCLHL